MPSSKRHYPYANPNAADKSMLANDFFQHFQRPRRNSNFVSNQETLAIWPSEAAIHGEAINFIYQAEDKLKAAEIVMDAIRNLFDFYKSQRLLISRIKHSLVSKGILTASVVEQI